jgi:hypothetical protein
MSDDMACLSQVVYHARLQVMCAVSPPMLCCMQAAGTVVLEAWV